MARARNGKLVQTKLAMLLYGKQGTWKSTIASQLTKFKREDGEPFRVLYIDGENGSIDDYLEDLYMDGVEAENIYIVYTQSLQEVKDYIGKVTKNENLYELDEDGDETSQVVTDYKGQPFRADAIVVDGASVLYMARQQGLVEFSKKRATVRANNKKDISATEKYVSIEGAGLEIKDYNTLKFDGQDLILDLMASGKHFVVTTREADEKVSVKDSEGKITSVVTGDKIPEGFKDMAYNVKTVIHLFEDEYGNVKGQIKGKDRTKIKERNEIIDNPSLSAWQQVIERNKNRQEFVLGNHLNSAVRKEMENAETTSLKEPVSTEEKEVAYKEQLISEAKDLMSKLTPSTKKSLSPKLKELNLNPQQLEGYDVETIKKFIEIIK